MSFWTNYKLYVCTHKIKQEYIADKIGMDYAAYRSLCSKQSDIRISTAIKMARAVGASLDYLADGTDSLSFDDRSLLEIAKKHADLLADLDVLSPDKLEIIKMQIKSVADFSRKTAEKVAK